MIKNYIQFNESLLNKLQGPNEEDVWKEFGYDRTFDTPEDFFLYIIKDIKIKEQTKFPDSVFWEKNGKIIFEQNFKNKELYVDYNTIWVIFWKVFNIDYGETQKIIIGVVEEYLNWKGFTPNVSGGRSYDWKFI